MADEDDVGEVFERFEPVCTRLLDAAANAGEIRADLGAHELMRGVASLCAGAAPTSGYDARRLVDLLVAGLRTDVAARHSSSRA